MEPMPFSDFLSELVDPPPPLPEVPEPPPPPPFPLSDVPEPPLSFSGVREPLLERLFGLLFGERPDVVVPDPLDPDLLGESFFGLCFWTFGACFGGLLVLAKGG
jgi:hypothetical protein